MKIAYLLDEDISKESGVVKKIKSQTDEWKKQNIEVVIISLRSEGTNSILQNSLIISLYQDSIGVARKFVNHYKNIEFLNEILKKEKIDLIYTRYIRFSPNLIRVLTTHAPYIVEINSNEVEEMKFGSKVSYWLNLWTRGIFFSNSLGMVSVSNELREHRLFYKYKKPMITIGNGYSLDSKKIKKNIFKNKKVKYVFIGTPNQKWHGMDKIIFLAKELIEAEFHIVGYTKKELEKSFGKLSSNIIAYGYVTQNKADTIIDGCDIGISTLGLYKKGMVEASPLKSRQYLAHGLPIIIGYIDTDFQDEKYILNIGNYENNMIDNIRRIRVFEKEMQEVSKENIFIDVVEKISYLFKEKKRIEFFKKCLLEAI